MLWVFPQTFGVVLKSSEQVVFHWLLKCGDASTTSFRVVSRLGIQGAVVKTCSSTRRVDSSFKSANNMLLREGAQMGLSS